MDTHLLRHCDSSAFHLLGEIVKKGRSELSQFSRTIHEQSIILTSRTARPTSALCVRGQFNLMTRKIKKPTSSQQ